MTFDDARSRKRATWAWALWDWAEQPFPTIMQTFIFPVYLAGAVAAVGTDSDSLLGITTGIAGVIVALMAPVFGRRSDESGKRKFWLMVNTYILVAIMIAAFFVQPKPEFLLFGLVLYGLGSIVQESAFINYYAMLRQVSTPTSIGKVSGYAWGLGYAGGIILLCISLFGFILPGTVFGFAIGDSMPVRITFLFSAVWFALFSIPLFRRVPEIEPKENRKKESLWASYIKLWGQLQSLRRQAPDTFKFLISSAIYRDGLAGVFTFGAVLGTLAFGFSQTEVILFGIAANIVAGIGAAVGGRLDDKLGSRAVIIGSLIGLIIAGSAVFAFAGVGPAQAASRTFVSRFTPVGREGEVFGLYQTTGRAVSFLSGFMWAGSITIASLLFGLESATIYGIIGIIVILVVGLVLLLRVNPNPSVAYSK
jgi:UMF1 family MFS transporter